MTTTRWTFTEVATDEVAILPRNPDRMSSPYPRRSLNFTPSLQGRPRTIMQAGAPVEWTFGGPIAEQSHHDLLLDWSTRPGYIDVTDHRGWKIRCFFADFKVSEVKPTKSNPNRYRYEMQALVVSVTPI